MEAADPALVDEAGDGVERHEPVRILVRERDVEAAVDALVAPRLEPRLAAERVAKPRPARAPIGRRSGFPCGTQPASVTSATSACERSGTGGGGSTRSKPAADLGARLAGELREQEIDRALRARRVRLESSGGSPRGR